MGSRVLLGVLVAVVTACATTTIIGLQDSEYDIYGQVPMAVVPAFYYTDYRIVDECLGDESNGRSFGWIEWYVADSIIRPADRGHYGGLYISPVTIVIGRRMIYRTTARHELTHYLSRSRLRHEAPLFKKCAGEA